MHEFGTPSSEDGMPFFIRSKDPALVGIVTAAVTAARLALTATVEEDVPAEDMAHELVHLAITYYGALPVHEVLLMACTQALVQREEFDSGAVRFFRESGVWTFELGGNRDPDSMACIREAAIQLCTVASFLQDTLTHLHTSPDPETLPTDLRAAYEGWMSSLHTMENRCAVMLTHASFLAHLIDLDTEAVTA